MPDFNIEKIHDTVWVFHNALKNPEEIIEYYKNNKPWKDWYTFGEMTEMEGKHYIFNNFPTQQEWDAKFNELYPIDNEENSVRKKIDSLFYETTKLYLEENNISLSNWIYQGWNIAKYIPNPNHNFGYIMHHHTDFQREKTYQPGVKFGVTAVFYLNDNYEGGEVDFRFIQDETLQVVLEDYSYKPSAGDVVIFLSGHPHYHGVRTVTSGDKYMIRTYWRYNQDAHPKWLEFQEKYGKEVWEQMEEKRLKFTYRGENQQIINNIPKFIGFEEYYDKLEKGEIQP